MKTLWLSLQMFLCLCIGVFNTCKAVDLAIQPFINPTPVQTTEGKLLVYELYIKNQGTVPVTIGRIEVYDPAEKTKPLGVYADEDLVKNSIFFKQDAKTQEFKSLRGVQEINPNTESLVYMFLTLKDGQRVPEKLEHEIWSTTLIEKKKLTVDKIKVDVDVNNNPPVVLEYPLKGKDWIAEAAVSPDSYHRRAILPIEGKLYLAQRFAIDWVHSNAEGQEVKNDLNIPENWSSYGQEVLAVCDGVITKVHKGLQDQVPPGLPSPPKLTTEALKEVTGNSIILSTEQNGEKFYILYAHLKPDSILVKEGDHVVAGQVIAQVGNTGNSASPHLHMHVCNVNEALKCEGIPFVFKEAKVQGIAGVISVGYGQWKWNTQLETEYAIHDKIIPTQNQVLDFSQRK